jgi:hypothetical protein
MKEQALALITGHSSWLSLAPFEAVRFRHPAKQVRDCGGVKLRFIGAICDRNKNHAHRIRL